MTVAVIVIVFYDNNDYKMIAKWLLQSLWISHLGHCFLLTSGTWWFRFQGIPIFCLDIDGIVEGCQCHHNGIEEWLQCHHLWTW